MAGRPSETRTAKWLPAPSSKTPAPKKTPESCARRQCSAAGTIVPSSSLTSRVKATAYLTMCRIDWARRAES